MEINLENHTVQINFSGTIILIRNFRLLKKKWRLNNIKKCEVKN